MTTALWTARTLPPRTPEVSAVWEWAMSAVSDITALRARLREEVVRAGSVDDDVERLLLAFEELTSNGIRHGGAPVRVTVTATAASWLIDVSDSAVDSPPTPAVGRDAAEGGLGLYLVARLCSAHGWTVRGDRKHVWARVQRVPPTTLPTTRPLVRPRRAEHQHH